MIWYDVPLSIRYIYTPTQSYKFTYIIHISYIHILSTLISNTYVSCYLFATTLNNLTWRNFSHPSTTRFGDTSTVKRRVKVKVLPKPKPLVSSSPRSMLLGYTHFFLNWKQIVSFLNVEKNLKKQTSTCFTCFTCFYYGIIIISFFLLLLLVNKCLF